ncbi:hypothetical protein ACFLYA_02980 [Candidatus Dependentiae bacterium]
MNKKKLFILCLSFFMVQARASDLFEIDKIETIIYGPEETSIITKSDLARVGLDGQARTKEKLIFELLVLQDAKRYNILDEKLVDRYIEALQREQNLSLEDLKRMFRDYGYTYEEGREQLAAFNTINQLLDFKVRSKVIIPEKEVRAFFEANPAFVDKAYNLQRIFVPVPADSNIDAEKTKIAYNVKIGEIPGADYSDPFWVEDKHLAADKDFIKNMNLDEFSEPIFFNGGFEIFKLIEKREKQDIPFEQRYREIVDTLRAPLFDKLFDEYKKNLHANSVIVELP